MASDTKGNTNIEIDELGDLLIPNYRHCVMKDELKLMKPNEKETLIVNLNDSDQRGSHWILIYKNRDQKIFFCSYGSSPPQEVIDYLGKNIYTSNLQVQHDNSSCGLFCILLAYLLNENIPFEVIILDLYRI